jgi:hypothetical protein
VLQVAALSTIVALLAGHAIYNVFDRYLLMAMPSVLLMAAVERGAKPATWSDAPGWGAAIVVGLFAVISTRDSMQWQRARWDLLDRVAAAGISSDVLDGGEEFNAVARGHSGAPDALYELRLVSDGENEPFCARPDIWLGPRAKAICLLKKDGVPAR